jgi:proline iminopeptidase
LNAVLQTQGEPALRTRYPAIEPYDSGFLDVGDGHSLYWEACGNPQGRPALFLHGGPGGGCSHHDRRLCDPRRYRILLLDQRGAGRSRPLGGLVGNTTAHLVLDIERLRTALGIDRWLLLGGSWGATLALAYAERHAEHVAALVLRGVFAAREQEWAWIYGGAAGRLLPKAWSRFARGLPDGEVLNDCLRQLTSGDAATETAAAERWCAWEDALIDGIDAAEPPPARPAPARWALARIEAHYAAHRGFLREGELLRSAARLARVPGVIVQGSLDLVTPPATARALAASWPAGRLQQIPQAGHASGEAGICDALVRATDRFAADLEPWH